MAQGACRDRRREMNGTGSGYAAGRRDLAAIGEYFLASRVRLVDGSVIPWAPV